MKLSKLHFIGFAYLIISLYPVGSGIVLVVYLLPMPYDVDGALNFVLGTGYWGIWVIINSLLGLLLAFLLLTTPTRIKLFYALLLSGVLAFFNMASALLYANVVDLLKSGRVELFFPVIHGILLYSLARQRRIEKWVGEKPGTSG